MTRDLGGAPGSVHPGDAVVERPFDDLDVAPRGLVDSTTSGMSGRTPHVVIVGGGFGGLYAAKALRKAAVRVTMIDRRNHHIFQPLLYQVASAGLNPSDIAAPIRGVLGRQKNVRVVLAEAIDCDLKRRKLILREGALAYDYLILATGATHSYHGREAWSGDAPGLKTIEDALDIRRRVLLAYEGAEREAETSRRLAWMTFVIVGGGPTGTELAGALSEIARHALTNDFRSIDPSSARVILVHSGDRLLPSFAESLSRKAREQLERIGVEVRLNARVTNVDGEGVLIGDEQIPARTVIWAAGVVASPLAARLGAPIDRAGRVLVEPDLSISGHPEVFAIGDMAARSQDGRPVFGLAPAAIQAGRATAENIQRAMAGHDRVPFRYVHKGSLATIGRRAAVAEFGWFKVSGLLAWLVWALVHVLSIVGFRNRASVILQWTWSYITYQRGVRLITGEALRYTSPKVPLLLSDESDQRPEG